jgi:hypothetical protein
MGQYYKIVFLAEKQDGSKEIIRAWITPNRSKLMEHSYLDNEFLHVIEFLLSRGMFYRSRIVWAGDYAEPEDEDVRPQMTREEAFAFLQAPSSYEDDDKNPNLYQLCKDGTSLHYIWRSMIEVRQLFYKKLYSYLVNHTKKQYVHIRKDGKHIHPLPLLVSEGNGNGGGDYFGRNEELCGTWARDIISVEDSIPVDYTELVCDFAESL